MAWRATVKWVSIGLFGWLAIREVAGKVTLVNAKVDVDVPLTDLAKELAPHWAIPIALVLIAMIAILANVRLRRLNSNLSRRVGELTERYERLSDPDRTSSGLGAGGQTHERDDL